MFSNKKKIIKYKKFINNINVNMWKYLYIFKWLKHFYVMKWLDDVMKWSNHDYEPENAWKSILETDYVNYIQFIISTSI